MGGIRGANRLNVNEYDVTVILQRIKKAIRSYCNKVFVTDDDIIQFAPRGIRVLKLAALCT